MPRGRCWSLFCSGSLLCSFHLYSIGSLNDRIQLAIIYVEVQHGLYNKGHHYCNIHEIWKLTVQLVIIS